MNKNKRKQIKEKAIIFIILLGFISPMIMAKLLPFYIGFIINLALEVLFSILLVWLDDDFFLTLGVSYIVSILVFWGTIGYPLMHILPQVMLKLFDFIQTLF